MMPKRREVLVDGLQECDVLGDDVVHLCVVQTLLAELVVVNKHLPRQKRVQVPLKEQAHALCIQTDHTSSHRKLKVCLGRMAQVEGAEHMEQIRNEHMLFGNHSTWHGNLLILQVTLRRRASIDF